jgi:hypothetical protein
MTIKAINGQAQQLVNQNTQNMGRYSTWLPRIASNVGKLAVPAIALYAMANIPGANAGPATYLACVEACFALAGWWFPPAIPVCVTGCLPLLAAPTI